MTDEERRVRRREQQAMWARQKRAQSPEQVRARQREYEQGRAEERAAWKRAYRLANLDVARAQGRAAQQRAMQRRREAVAAIKAAKGCADCGYNAHHAALDFDHLDRRVKTKSVSWLVNHNAPWVKVMAEIDKCEVVCANCHRVRTHSRGDWIALTDSAPCGHVDMYADVVREAAALAGAA